MWILIYFVEYNTGKLIKILTSLKPPASSRGMSECHAFSNVLLVFFILFQYCLEEHCRRLEAESRVHELNEKLERLESHYAELEKIHTDLKNVYLFNV